MFNLILTLVRGRAHDAEQAFADCHAMPLLAQQIRDAAASIQSARRAVAIAIGQNGREKDQYSTIVARIADLEDRTVAALQKGNDGLAREAADAIVYLEAERDASQKAQEQFTSAIGKLQEILRSAEARLRDLQRGERLARATLEANKLDVTAGSFGLATLDEAEETLGRLRARQSQQETTAAVLKEMDGASHPARIVEKLANAGCGAPLRASADDVLARLRGRMTPAA